jgi:hypothetical protein
MAENHRLRGFDDMMKRIPGPFSERTGDKVAQSRPRTFFAPRVSRRSPQRSSRWLSASGVSVGRGRLSAWGWHSVRCYTCEVDWLDWLLMPWLVWVPVWLTIVAAIGWLFARGAPVAGIALIGFVVWVAIRWTRPKGSRDDEW